MFKHYPERTVPSESLARTQRLLELERRVIGKYAGNSHWQNEQNKLIDHRSDLVRKVQELQCQLADPMDLQDVFVLQKKIAFAKVDILDFDNYCIRQSGFQPRLMDLTRVAAILIFLIALLIGSPIFGQTNQIGNRQSAIGNSLQPLTNADGTLMSTPRMDDPLGIAPKYYNTWGVATGISATNRPITQTRFPTNLTLSHTMTGPQKFWLNYGRTNSANSKLKIKN